MTWEVVKVWKCYSYKPQIRTTVKFLPNVAVDSGHEIEEQFVPEIWVVQVGRVAAARDHLEEEEEKNFTSDFDLLHNSSSRPIALTSFWELSIALTILSVEE